MSHHAGRFELPGAHQGKSLVCAVHLRSGEWFAGARGDPCAWTTLRGDEMAAMKPRTGDGPLEVTKEGRGIVMRVPLEGGGRLVVELTAAEAGELGEALHGVVG